MFIEMHPLTEKWASLDQENILNRYLVLFNKESEVSMSENKRKKYNNN